MINASKPHKASITMKKRCGVAFCGSRLKLKDIEDLKKTEGVKGIAINIPIKDVGVVEDQDPIRFQDGLNVNKV